VKLDPAGAWAKVLVGCAPATALSVPYGRLAGGVEWEATAAVAVAGPTIEEYARFRLEPLLPGTTYFFALAEEAGAGRQTAAMTLVTPGTKPEFTGCSVKKLEATGPSTVDAIVQCSDEVSVYLMYGYEGQSPRWRTAAAVAVYDKNGRFKTKIGVGDLTCGGVAYDVVIVQDSTLLESAPVQLLSSFTC
jgi:hypothetical protein